MLSGLSYNIYLGKNLPQIANWLNHFSKPFDIICFQEFPYSQIESFQSKSTYASHFAASFRKRGEVYGELTLILKKKIDILHVEIIDLGRSISEQRIFGTSGTRSSLVTKLSYNGTSFMLANTHLTALASHSHRRKQLYKLLEYLGSQTYSQNVPIIILGDLNYSSLVGQKSLIELMEKQEYTNAYLEDTHTFLKIKDHQLDYIFYKNCFIPEVKVLRQPFSDHFPVKFTLSL